MGIGASVFLLAAGAILTFAIDANNSSGIDLDAIGVILMIAGAIGLVMFAAVFGRRDRVVERGTTVVESPRVYERRI